mmetsp:Transcript_18896/g.49232  ORF Transcript_18896/g.49232 Transcript_18896/m.49232 type:complete len:85 (-) Transcript_18896:1527-1781(-)
MENTVGAGNMPAKLFDCMHHPLHAIWLPQGKQRVGWPFHENDGCKRYGKDRCETFNMPHCFHGRAARGLTIHEKNGPQTPGMYG